MDVCQLDILKTFSAAFDLVNPDLVGHHEQVAYIAARIADQMGLSTSEQLTVIMASLVHDVGALQHTIDQRLKILSFEANGQKHSEVGHRLLKIFEPFEDLAQIVKYHHLRWDKDSSDHTGKETAPLGSHIVHLADRVAILINKKQVVLSQVEKIVKRINDHKGTIFHPNVVDAFQKNSNNESFWLDAVSPSPVSLLKPYSEQHNVIMSNEDLLAMAKVLSQIIDFRSRFTATHSAGVAAVAEKLAELSGLSQVDCEHMRIAAYVHDLGKLAVPNEILEKPGKLTADEFNIVKSHTYFTYRILEKIPALKTINEWASYHHEKIDGKGYPFHVTGEDMSLGSKIMAVADVFTAITEDRPYRQGMSKEQTLQVLEKMAQAGALHTTTVELLIKHLGELIEVRHAAQAEAKHKYEFFSDQIMSLQ